MPSRLTVPWKYLKSLSLLQVCIGVSVAVHAGLFGFRFIDPEGFNRTFQDTPLEVILVNAGSEAKPDKAQALAQQNLAGGGEATDNRRATSPLPPSPTNEVGESLEQTARMIDQMQQEQQQLQVQRQWCEDLAKAQNQQQVAQHNEQQALLDLADAQPQLEQLLASEPASKLQPQHAAWQQAQAALAQVEQHLHRPPLAQRLTGRTEHGSIGSESLDVDPEHARHGHGATPPIRADSPDIRRAAAPSAAAIVDEHAVNPRAAARSSIARPSSRAVTASTAGR